MESNQEVISQGKSLALAIKGLMAINLTSNGYGAVESRVRPQLVKLYRRELKRILMEVSKPTVNEILAIVGPDLGSITTDPSEN